jgi:Uma2 family endonuclease
MSATLVRPITIEEFKALPYAQTERMEVVRGILTPKDPIDRLGTPMCPGAEHGSIQLEVAARLREWARKNGSGFVGVEVAFVLDRDPVTIRIPDVSFLGTSRRPEGKIPAGPWTVPPDLAVEVISPSELAVDVRRKIALYLESSVQMVWTVYPEIRGVGVSISDGEERFYRLEDTLHFPDILPGFSCKVEEFFA